MKNTTIKAFAEEIEKTAFIGFLARKGVVAGMKATAGSWGKLLLGGGIGAVTLSDSISRGNMAAKSAVSQFKMSRINPRKFI